jgi:hypothetical protein
MTLVFDAHSDGKVIVPDEPRTLPTNARLRVRVEVLSEKTTQMTARRLPITLDVETVRAIAEDPQQPWRPLDVQIDPALGQAIAEDPEFNIEES